LVQTIAAVLPVDEVPRSIRETSKGKYASLTVNIEGYVDTDNERVRERE